MNATTHDRTPVVLLHGWGGSYATTWLGSGLERTLRGGGRTVLRCDLPGHAAKRVSHDPADYEFISDQLLRSLPEADVFDGVGFSLGGKLLLQLAAQWPGRFRRIVIGGVGENIFRPEAGDIVASALRIGVAPDAPAALRPVLEHARNSGNDLGALAAVIRRPARPVTPEALSAIEAKVLLVIGSDDSIAGRIEPLAQSLPNAHQAVIEGLDHVNTPMSDEFQYRAAAFILQPA